VVGVARFIDAVETALLRRTSEQRKRKRKRKVTMAAVPRKTAENSGEKPGVCAKKAKDSYFISRHRL
jgi:hypothetical protein